MRRLNVANRTQAAVRAASHGLAEITAPAALAGIPQRLCAIALSCPVTHEIPERAAGTEQERSDGRPDGDLDQMSLAFLRELPARRTVRIGEAGRIVVGCPAIGGAQKDRYVADCLQPLPRLRIPALEGIETGEKRPCRPEVAAGQALGVRPARAGLLRKVSAPSTGEME